jgi:ElaB/YqjD/DUF883 family membrane-anchored ribosome-binding protein
MSVSQQDLNAGRINDQLGSQLESISAQVEAKVERGRDALAEWQATFKEKSAEFAETMKRYSHEHPWRLVSSGLALGLALGMIFGCQSSRRSARF